MPCIEERLYGGEGVVAQLEDENSTGLQVLR